MEANKTLENELIKLMFIYMESQKLINSNINIKKTFQINMINSKYNLENYLNNLIFIRTII